MVTVFFQESVNVSAQTKGLQTFLQPSVPTGIEAPQLMPPEIREDTHYVTSDNDDYEDTNDDDHILDNESTYMKDPEYFDNLVDNVDLSYIGREEEPIPAPLTSTISAVKSWDSFKIDDIDIVKFFSSLRNSLPKKTPEVQ